ncbi:MAG: DNA-formamidopyrimidine glycosylase family protein [Pseudomonadota bacterium]
MPELPDISVYIAALKTRLLGARASKFVFQSPFVLRTVEPASDEFVDREIVDLRRIGKRIALGFEQDYWIVIHLMIAGRFAWLEPQKKVPKAALAYLEFEHGTLALTEAGSKKRASIHLSQTADVYADFDPGGAEIAELNPAEFGKVLTKNNHTLKRALTDPKLFSGIGNAYSDEILHHAKLSPIQQTQKLETADIENLFSACVEVLQTWTERLADFYGDKFPTKVTAFREGMAVHGRYQQACPVCGTAVQRIRYATNEVNYCPRC